MTLSERDRIKAVRDAVSGWDFVQRLARWGAGGGTIPKFVLKRVNPHGTFDVATADGRSSYKYIADASDATRRDIAWALGWEQTSLTLACDLMQLRDGIFVDVGAYSGIFSLNVAMSSGKAVLAIEPSPVMAAVLRRNISANHIDEQVAVHEVAVSDLPGRARLIVPQGGDTSLARIGPAGSDVEGALVEVVRIDDLVGDARVAVMKMDVEGHELAALMGAKDCLVTHQPKLIIELLADESFSRVIEYLFGLGYQAAYHISSKGLRPVESFVYEPFHSNFYFE